MSNALDMLQDLADDLLHHEEWEGHAVEVRTRSGGWQDVFDRIHAVMGVLG